ncbi:hypothetical protein F383_02566 [Gossypium arboreum]|uniref:Uncharacterized protein n=1 Tax=Gossypium arboreum TaxID=29729 RepID=A0A0B0PRB9_GOSAR|nr:hypothetical protein F383_02566 [Gossypium arboreum]
MNIQYVEMLKVASYLLKMLKCYVLLKGVLMMKL